ncbi:hypothetical protein FA15DRAFT_723032 [Coprinopsis marcescibilis]|uniref:DUF6533 domain-containing protein n=1 Tax=Coprinopsis marcescibilis TaxID=230819 RepID=A0A5C3L606_COPMA|nr:hypothetical protein FA15DRAFT_723032 [Coprinopsis marcescibilis]
MPPLLQYYFTLLVDWSTFKRINAYIHVSMMTLTIIDYLQTLHLEVKETTSDTDNLHLVCQQVKYVWNGPRSPMNVVLILARYAFLIIGPMGPYLTLVHRSICVNVAQSMSATYGYWGIFDVNRHPPVRSDSVSTGLFNLGRKTNFHGIPSAPFHYCPSWEIHAASKGRSICSISYCEAFNISGLCIVSRERNWKFGQCHGSHLYTVFFRDGAIYFVSLTMTALINTLMNLLAPYPSYGQCHPLYENDSSPTTSVGRGTYCRDIEELATTGSHSVPPLNLRTYVLRVTDEQPFMIRFSLDVDGIDETEQ